MFHLNKRSRTLFKKNRERWHFPEVDAKAVKSLSETYKLNNMLARLVHIRKLEERKNLKIEEFLKPSEDLLKDVSELADPVHLKNALNRIQKALENNERICINGDPDADGITGCAILTTALKTLGADVYYDFPTRAKEGHGLQTRIIDEASHKNTKLIITVDCGSKDIEATDYANSQNIDVIICDHHTLGKNRPQSIALINPYTVDHKTLNQSLSGAGTAYKLIVALFKHLDESLDNRLDNFLLALATLGTISDRMSLLNPLNRILIKKGVESINKTNYYGLKILKEISAPKFDKLRPRDIARTIVPRLNAPGRIGDREEGIPDSRIVVDLLLLGVQKTSKSVKNKIIQQFKDVIQPDAEQKFKEEASLEATVVDDVNERRKYITSKIEDEIEQLIEEQVDQDYDKIIIVKGKNWNPGVIGIDTDRLKERFLRPAIILTEYEGNDYIRGSVRSIPTIGMYDIIDKVNDIFQENHNRPLFAIEVKTEHGSRLVNAFGGHAQACGFTLHKDDVDEFIKLTRAEADKLSDDDFNYSYEILNNLTFEQLSAGLVKKLDSLMPYGQEFEYPIFYLKSCHISRPRPFGNKYQKSRTPHFDFLISNAKNQNQREQFQAVGFGLWEKYNELKLENKTHVFDIIFTIDEDQHSKKRPGKGQINTQLRLNVQDIRVTKS